MTKDSNTINEIKEIRNILKDMDIRLEKIENSLISKDKEILLDYIWDDAKEMIKLELTDVSFNTWIKPIIHYEIKDNTLYLQAINDFSKGILEARYMNLIHQAVNQVSGSSLNIEFIVEEEFEI